MAAAAPKRCLYEVLGVARDCSDADIKAAYRRLVLTTHPDKLPPGSSPADLAAATAAFQELSSAFQVLSDQKERAYYDSHRSQILFSEATASGSRSSGGIDVFAFFSSSAFSGFSDTGRGFYKVYGDVFTRVYAQEVDFARKMGIQSPSPAPLIGNLESPHSQVAAFYNYWLGFSTVLDFAWVGEYDVAAGINRRSRRLMEEENKKLQKKARREYTDSVRGLAAFAKKRDQRVVEMVRKKRIEEEKRSAEEARKKKEEAKKKIEKAKAFVEPEWSRVEEEQADFFNDDDDDGGEKRKKELYCVACNKKFKSDKQWENHEQSKKHREKVAELKKVFAGEEKVKGGYHLGADKGSDLEGLEADDIGFFYEPAIESDDGGVWAGTVDETCEDFEHDLKVDGSDIKGNDLGVEEEDATSDDESIILNSKVFGHKSKAVEDSSQYLSDLDVNHHKDATSEQFSDDHDDDDGRRESRQKRVRKKHRDKADHQAAEDEKNESETDESVRQKKEANDDLEQSSSLLEEEVVQSKTSKPSEKKQNQKKNNNKSMKEPGSDAVSDQKSSRGKKKKDVTKPVTNDCETCGQCFDSRNKLFAHLGDTGHAMLKEQQRAR